MQNKIDEADRIYDDLVEQAVTTIYETTQDALDLIADHKVQTVQTPTPDIPQVHSGDVRNHPTRPGLMPTP